MRLCTEENCIGYPIKNLHLNSNDLTEFEDRLLQAHRKGKMLENYEFNIKTFSGNIKTLRVNAKLITDQNSEKILGRIGIVFDVNNAVDEIRRELKQDFEDFLHNYYHQLLNIKGSLISIVNAHATEVVVDGEINPKLAVKLMNSYLKRVELDWEILKKELLSRNSDVNIKEINEILTAINSNPKYNSDNIESREERANWVRLNLIDFRQKINKIYKNKYVNKEIIKPVLNDIVEVLRYARLVSLSIIINGIQPFLDEIDKFKTDVFYDATTKISEFNPIKKMNEAISSLSEYAQNKNVNIRLITSYSNLKFYGDERECYRAFYNLVHNAIKYSRYLDIKQKSSYVRIEFSEDQECIYIEIENLGVPIRKNELEKQLIYKFRFRGASAIEDREGSGIGLWSVKKYFDKIGGEINIESKPIGYNKEEDYTKFFKTTVYLKIKKV